MMRTFLQIAACCGLLVMVVGCNVPLKVGAAAPDFSGMTDEGQTFKLSDHKGKSGVVIYFYPENETPGCITEACRFQDRLGKLREKGYQLVGISCASIDSHKTFKNKYGLKFPLIADEDGKIAQAFGVPMESRIIGGKKTLLVDRQTFIIDKDGKVIQQFKVEDPEEHVRKTLEALEVPY